MNKLNMSIYSFSFEFDDDIVYLCDHELSKVPNLLKKSAHNINSIIDNYEYVSIFINYSKSKLGANFNNIILHVDILYFDKIIVKLTSTSISIGKNKRQMYIHDYSSNLNFDIYTFSDFKNYLNKIISYKINLLTKEFKINDFIKFKTSFMDKRLAYYEIECDSDLITITDYLKTISYSRFNKTVVPDIFKELCESFLKIDKGKNQISLKENKFDFKIRYGTYPCIQIKNPVFYIYDVDSSKKEICIKFLYYVLHLNNELGLFKDEFEKIMLNQK